MRRYVGLLTISLVVSSGVLAAQETRSAEDPKKEERYETRTVWVAKLIPSLTGPTLELGVFNTKQEADEACRRWDEANERKGKDKSLSLTKVDEATVRVPIRRLSASGGGRPQTEVSPPKIVTPGAASQAAPRSLLVQGKFGQGGKTVPATINLTVQGSEVTGVARWQSGGGQMELRISGVLQGDQFTAKTYFNGEHWSNWRGTLDMTKGTLEGTFIPMSRRADPTPGTIAFSRP